MKITIFFNFILLIELFFLTLQSNVLTHNHNDTKKKTYTRIILFIARLCAAAAWYIPIGVGISA